MDCLHTCGCSMTVWTAAPLCQVSALPQNVGHAPAMGKRFSSLVVPTRLFVGHLAQSCVCRRRISSTILQACPLMSSLYLSTAFTSRPLAIEKEG